MNQPPLRNRLVSGTEVDADVKAGVIPIGVVMAAPIAVLIHAIHGVMDLGTIVAVSRGFVIDAGPIALKPLMATRGVIVIRERRRANGKYQTAG